MKKKNLLLFAALALSASASAQEVVTVTSTDGKKEFDKGQITTFTFDNGVRWNALKMSSAGGNIWYLLYSSFTFLNNSR